MILDDIKMTGRVDGVINYADGRTERFIEDNLVVTAGKGLLASRLAANTNAAVSHMAAGTSTAANTNPAQTGLTTETGTRSAATPTVNSNAVTFAATFTGRTETMAELGLFNAATGGTMISRVLVGPFPLTSGDSVSFNWTITVN
jgi:hypothetical protein